MSGEDTGDSAQADTAVLPPGSSPRSPRDDTASDPDHIGRYRVLSRLGAGGMGIVYAARDEELDRKVAIKLLRVDDRFGSEGPARLKREAQALAKLSHPNVVHVYEVGQHETQVYLAMELVQGRTLRSWQLGDRTWREVVAMYVAAGRGLAAAHAAGIVHRDFKPDNVLVGADGRPRVLDFGLARPDASTSSTVPPRNGDLAVHELTEAGTVLGTPAYMPPEQLEGLDIDARCDQFSFCVSLFEALHGTRPFAGKTIAELSANVARGAPATVDLSRRGVPRDLQTAIATGLAADPRARHADMATLLAALERAAARRRGVQRWFAGFATATALAAGAVALWPDPPATPSDTIDAPDGTDPRAEMLATSDLPPELATPLPGDPLGVTVHRLDNGLTVYVVPRRDRPMVRVSIAVRMGADDGPPDRPGVHHMAAHMLDAGSLKLGSRDPEAEATLLRQRDDLFAQLEHTDDPRARLRTIQAIDAIEREAAALTIADERIAVLREAGARELDYLQDAGLVVNADVPGPSLDLLLAVEADRMRNPSFRGYLAETNTLLAEARQETDGARVDSLRAWELLAPSIGGWASPVQAATHLATLPFAAVRDAFAERFVPNNVSIVLVGDVETAAALGAIEAAFGDWQPARLPAPPAANTPVEGGRIFEAVVGTGGSRATVAFPLPPALRDDRRAVLLLADILSNAVPDPNGPLPSVESLQAAVRNGVLEIAATPDQRAQLDDIEAEIVDVLETAAAGRLDAARVAEAIAHRELAAARLSTDEHDIARVVAESYVERRSWSAATAELAAPATGDLSLAVAARALLDHGRVVVFRTEGRYEPPSIPRLPVDAIEAPQGGRSAFATALLAEPRSRIEPQFLLAGRHFTRRDEAGVTVVATRTDPPLFRAGVRWPVGVGHDWWTCDAVSAHVAALQRHLHREGVALEVDCDRNSTTVRIEGPQARFDGAWTRVLDRLGDATLTDDEIRTHVDATLARRRRARADPDRVFESLVELATWEDGGAVEHALPTDEALERVNRTLFEASLLGVIETRPAVLYAGPDPTAIGDRLPAAGLREPPEPRAWRPRRPDQPLVLVVDLPGATTAVLTVSMAAPGTGGPEAATIYGQLLQARFVQRFRDAAGWGRMDDVAQQLHAVGDASFVARAWVAYDRVPAATEAALALMGGTIDRAAFDGALRSVEESVRADRVRPHRIPETAMAWMSASDPRLVTWERLAAADIEALQQYVRAAAEAAPVIAVGGELREIDLDALRELGTVTVVERDDLCRGG